MDFVVLVDRNNRKIGIEEKMKAHAEAKLHRAFSIFVFNRKGELLLQQRAKSKYHCPGIWANTCCSHPKPGESYSKAIHRRLKEEMGIDCRLRKLFSFVYRAKFSNGLTEHEHDTVFMGTFEGTPKPNSKEVMSWKWMQLKRLNADIKSHPAIYSAWLKKALKMRCCIIRLVLDA